MSWRQRIRRRLSRRVQQPRSTTVLRLDAVPTTREGAQAIGRMWLARYRATGMESDGVVVEYLGPYDYRTTRASASA